jgi:prephenate dehydratase
MEKSVIYLGPEGSYTEIAAEKVIELSQYDNVKKQSEPSIIRVIESIDKNINQIGVIPIENSIEGIVRETVDNLLKTTSRVLINQEIIIPISHCLISKSDNISSVTKVISISQALAQCRNYLDSNFKNAELVTATSTSEAVRQLLQLPDNFAAIGNPKAAELYDLNILASNINDEKDNQTRFVCIGSEMSKPTGNDKTSIALSVCNQPGALADILQAFKANNINLSYIESRPSKRVFGEYTFFIDFDGHIENENIQQTVGKIKPMINFNRFLGSYPKYKSI